MNDPTILSVAASDAAAGVSDAEFTRLLGIPRGREVSEEVGERAALARQWYVEHGRPFVAVRRAGLRAVGPQSVTLETGEVIEGAALAERLVRRRGPRAGRHRGERRPRGGRRGGAALGRRSSRRVLFPRPVRGSGDGAAGVACVGCTVRRRHRGGRGTAPAPVARMRPLGDLCPTPVDGAAAGRIDAGESRCGRRGSRSGRLHDHRSTDAARDRGASPAALAARRARRDAACYRLDTRVLLPQLRPRPLPIPQGALRAGLRPPG